MDFVALMGFHVDTQFLIRKHKTDFLIMTALDFCCCLHVFLVGILMLFRISSTTGYTQELFLDPPPITLILFDSNVCFLK